MTTPIIPSDYTSAPLRHRLTLELRAPVTEVWAVVGDHRRLAEYSAGIAQVDVEEGGGTRVCHFRSPDGSDGGIVLRERVVWESPGVGYAASAEPGNAFGLTDDLSVVTVDATPAGTAFTWRQYYDHPDIAAMRADFDLGLADIGTRLAAMFGGTVVERYVDAQDVPARAG